jgi:uncharacterized protein
MASIRSTLAAAGLAGAIALAPAASAVQPSAERRPFDRYPANTPRALQELRDAAERGDADAQDDLGLLYRFGAAYYQRSGIEQNLEEAVKWFRRAADQGLDRGQFNLALCYLQGTGVPKNPAEAFRWLSKAAEQQRPQAEYGVGLLYLSGEGVAVDVQSGLAWIRKAAEHGHPAALGRLGDAYTSGEGVAADPVEAWKWFALCVARAAAAQQRDMCAVGRDAVSNVMTAAQVVDAQGRAAIWAANHRQ